LHESRARFKRTDGRSAPQALGFDGINAIRADAARLIVKGAKRWALIFSLAEGVMAWRDELQAARARYHLCLVWVKPDSMPRMNGQGPARGFETIVTAWCGPGYKRWNGGGKRGTYKTDDQPDPVYECKVNPRDRVKGRHPTEKPLKLMTALVSDFTNPGETILDPFMGSGSTGVACVQLGRRFIGIERDEKHFATARERIAAALAEPSLFKALIAEMKQSRLFGGPAA
jgi:site-specific DNA-methyltransferase (adenine-specific)